MVLPCNQAVKQPGSLRLPSLLLMIIKCRKGMFAKEPPNVSYGQKGGKRTEELKIEDMIYHDQAGSLVFNSP